MILPPSIGLFCQRLGAKPYAPERIETFSRTRDDSEEFGLGAVVVVETDQVRVSIGPRDGLDLSTMTSGVVGLYRVIDTREDYLIREIEFDVSMQRADGSWVIIFSRQEITDDLWVACDMVFASRTVSAIAPVVFDGTGRHTKELPFKLKQAPSLSAEDPLKTAPPVVVVVRDEELRTAMSVDFKEQRPVRAGAATVTYAGGGNRYLPSPRGPVLQQLGQAPWTLGAAVIIEDAGSNEFPGAGLFDKVWNWTATNNPTVADMQYELPGFSERLISFTVQDAKSINSQWKLDFNPILWSGETITASAFTEVGHADGNTSKFWLGLELLESDGTTVRDAVWTELGNAPGLKVSSATWPRPSAATAVSGKARLCVKITNLDPGDYCQIIVGFPQLEYSSSAGSRTTGTRQADTVTVLPTYAFDNTFGRFAVEFAPLYNGVPGAAGPQLILDTRDASGRNGFWVGHRSDGLFEFGIADALGTTFMRSASVVQLTEGELYKLNAYWDKTEKNLRLDLNGALLVEKNFNTFTLPDALTRIRVGARYNGAHAGNFQVFSLKHEHIT